MEVIVLFFKYKSPLEKGSMEGETPVHYTL